MVFCREKECEKLDRLLSGGFRNVSLPCVFVQGPPQGGKKIIANHCLKGVTDGRTALTSCLLTSCGLPVFLSDILAQLFPEKTPTDLSDKSTDLAANNLSDFVHKLARNVSELDNGKARLIIALTDAQQLRQQEFNLLPGFQRLQSLTGIEGLTVVLVSKLPWKKWEMEAMGDSPVTINVPPYTKEQNVQLLTQYLILNHSADLKNVEMEEAEDFFTNFSDMILGTFRAVCRTLPQLISVAKMTLPKYLEPVEKGQIEASNSRSLYRHVEAYLKDCLMTANLKESSSSNSEVELVSTGSNRLSVELPFVSKYLLIAAYLASYNPVSSDKRFFMKAGGKIKKLKNTVAAAARIAQHKRTSQLLGPRMFGMDRMLAIFYVIAEMQTNINADVLSQVSTLVSLGLLAQVGNPASMDSGLDAPKFKCNVSLDFIRLLSKNVRFEIHNYLYDLQSQ